MTKARNRDGDNPVQLFPFVAVLLCTMGALLVLLVSVARSSRARALEEATTLQAEARVVAAERAAESKKTAEASRRELELIAAHQRELDTARRQADEVLRSDRARMAHLEDHMRRLREQLETMKLAAAELNSLETARFDDQKQAQSEVERLEKLIEETRGKIEEQRAEASRRPKSYAIVPYEGQSGTRRRPVYIECREKEAVLQPEGVVFTIDDFRPPIGPGNPLVAALRAAREHIGRNELADAKGKAAEPYPLIIVRPAGVKFYYYVREAIQSWDSEFGYELVEEDWNLKYGAANPQLATVEFDAAELARARLQALAAAAPQAYGAYRFDQGSDENWGGFGDGYGGSGDGDGAGSGEGDGNSSYGRGEGMATSGRGGAGGAAHSGGRPGGGRIAAVIVKRQAVPAGGAASGSGQGQGGEAKTGQDASAASGANSQPSGSNVATNQSATEGSGGPAAAGGAPGQQGPGQQPTDGAAASGSYAGGSDPEQQLDQMARNAAAEDEGTARESRQKIRGKNWAIRNANQGMIPIRRTIQIEIRGDALVILPDASTSKTAPAGQEFAFGTAPAAAYEDLLLAIDKRIEDWGMAGEGLYWRPTIELRVAPDGDGRVDQLVHLLEHGGAEVRGEAVAQQGTGGGNGATQ